METSFFYDLQDKQMCFKLRQSLTAYPDLELKGKGRFNTVSGGLQYRTTLKKFVSAGTVEKGVASTPVRLGEHMTCVCTLVYMSGTFHLGLQNHQCLQQAHPMHTQSPTVRVTCLADEIRTTLRSGLALLPALSMTMMVCLAQACMSYHATRSNYMLAIVKLVHHYPNCRCGCCCSLPFLCLYNQQQQQQDQHERQWPYSCLRC